MTTDPVLGSLIGIYLIIAVHAWIVITTTTLIRFAKAGREGPACTLAVAMAALAPAAAWPIPALILLYRRF